MSTFYIICINSHNFVMLLSPTWKIKDTNVDVVVFVVTVGSFLNLIYKKK